MFLTAVFALQKKKLVLLNYLRQSWNCAIKHGSGQALPCMLGYGQRLCHQEHLSIHRENPSSVLASAAGTNMI